MPISPSQNTILAVDDSPMVHELIKTALLGSYRVLTTANAIEAISMLYRETVSVLLLDVTMPEVDGLELCRTVRSIPQFESLPIVMLTSRGSPFDKVQGRLAGATEYLTKPFKSEELFDVISRFAPANLS